ncbi:MAG: PqqD family protein [Lachnospiraceae bacterium]|nr:PqqD family protein [Lachnospiraceae bacterium]
MKLKKDIVTQEILDEQFMISLNDDSFQGMVRSNPTAAFIIEQLKKETTRDEIVDAMFKEYDADRKTIEADVDNILDMLKSYNVIEE